MSLKPNWATLQATGQPKRQCKTLKREQEGGIQRRRKRWRKRKKGGKEVKRAGKTGEEKEGEGDGEHSP